LSPPSQQQLALDWVYGAREMLAGGAEDRETKTSSVVGVSLDMLNELLRDLKQMLKASG